MPIAIAGGPTWHRISWLSLVNLSSHLAPLPLRGPVGQVCGRRALSEISGLSDVVPGHEIQDVWLISCFDLYMLW